MNPRRYAASMALIPRCRPPEPARAISAQADLLAKARKILRRIAHPFPERVLSVVSALTTSLADCFPGSGIAGASDITDDGTPFEFSLSFKPDGIDFRVLWEAQADFRSRRGTPLRLWSAAEEVNRVAAGLPGVAFDSLNTVRAGFTPQPGIPAHFSMWHALAFGRDGDFLLKTYLNPAARGTPLPTTLRALGELGRGRLASSVRRLLEARPQDRPLYFSVDLKRGSEARAKVYIGHVGATTNELEKLFRGLSKYRPGMAAGLISGFCASPGPFDRRPVISCLSARSRDEEPELTLHFPARCYVARDDETVAGLSNFLSGEQVSLLERVLSDDLCFSPSRGRGAISYVSRQKAQGNAGTTVYIQPHFLKPYLV